MTNLYKVFYASIIYVFILFCAKCCIIPFTERLFPELGFCNIESGRTKEINVVRKRVRALRDIAVIFVSKKTFDIKLSISTEYRDRERRSYKSADFKLFLQHAPMAVRIWRF